MRHRKRLYRRMVCLQCFGKERIGTETRSARGDRKDERDDLNNRADKLPEENDERLDKRAEEHEEMHY